jgi:tetratricopeptide (TPR) repeat protein
MRHLIICLFFLFIVVVKQTNAQLQPGPSETFSEAFDFFSYNEYAEALALFRSVYREDENNNHVRYLIGVCLLNIEGQKQKALPFLELARAGISADHKSGSFHEKSAPVENLYYLGIAYRLAYRFDESLEAFSQLKNLAGNRLNAEVINREIDITKNALNFHRNKEDITVLEEEKPPVLSRHRDIVISGDESTVVFTEEQKFYDAVLYTRKTEKGWLKPVNITMHLQSDGLAYPVCLSWDGTRLYLYQYDRLKNTNLYVSRFENNRWTRMEKLSENINSEGFDQHASVTRDGKTIYFASSRASGTGGFDIYSSRLGENGEWEPAVNLGHPVNTPYDESFPFISPDGETLYFSSTGHTGMGGYDIFMSRKSPSGKWTVPRNLGYPVNTPDDDVFLIPVADGTNAFYLIRKDENNDLREFQKISSFEVDTASSSTVNLNVNILKEKEGNISRSLSGQTSIKVHQLRSADTILTFQAKGLPGFQREFPWGDYLINIDSPGYHDQSIPFSIPEYYPEKKYTISADLVMVDLPPPPGPAGLSPLTIIPVLFGFDSHHVPEESLQGLRDLAETLSVHEGMTIELRAYTDALGSPEYNLALAARRAEAVANSLISQGAPVERITTTAIGMDHYVARNTTRDGRDDSEGRRYNRRVEFTVTNVPDNLRIEIRFTIPEHLKTDSN